jgi:hypothetical protein
MVMAIVIVAHSGALGFLLIEANLFTVCCGTKRRTQSCIINIIELYINTNTTRNCKLRARIAGFMRPRIGL